MLIKIKGGDFMVLLALGCTMVTMFIIHNLFCYKNKKFVYTLSDKKYIILNIDYYSTQLTFGLCNSILLLTFYLAWYMFSKNEPVFLFFTMIIFWGLNYMLEFYSRKKGYIGIKEQF